MQQLKCDHCDAIVNQDDINIVYTRKPELHLCDPCYEAWKLSMQDGHVGEAGAVLAFMGWLTSREQVSGPFSSHYNASEAARLVGKFCQMQGWDITDDEWHHHIKPYPAES